MRTKKRHQNSIQVLFFLLLSVLVLTYSCKKMDYIDVAKVNITERFFELPKNADPILKRIVEDLKQKNSLHPFVEQFVKNEGLPVWKYAKITIKRNHTDNVSNTEGTDTLVSVPIVPDGDAYVKDVLKVKINTEVLYKLFMGEQYASNGFDKDPNRTAPNAEDIVKQIMAFEKEMYYSSDSTVIYHIKDNRLFDSWPADTTKPQDFYIAMKFAAQICPIIEIVYISGWESCNSGKGNSSNITVPKCPIYTTVIIDACYEDNNDGGGWSSYPEGEPGGGGGTTTSPDSTANPPNNLPGECGEGRNWVVYVIDANTGEWKNPCTEEPPPTVPLPDEPSGNTSPPFPTSDSLLASISRAIISKADSIFNLSTQQNYNEWGMIIVKKNGVIYAKNEKTNNNPNWVKFNLSLAPGEVLIGDLHVHNDPDSLGRSTFSGDDLAALRRSKGQYQYVKFVECGNVRYALVIEDVAKADSFFLQHPDKSIEKAIWDSSYTHPQMYSNWQFATQVTVKNYLGPSSECGIGFYISNNGDKTSYTKLN